MALIPFSEEPWLRETLGAQYEEYAARVPRYLGFGQQRPAGRNQSEHVASDPNLKQRLE